MHIHIYTHISQVKIVGIVYIPSEKSFILIVHQCSGGFRVGALDAEAPLLQSLLAFKRTDEVPLMLR